jgi:hypothetical protein
MLTLVLAASVLASAPPQSPLPAPAAKAILDTALARMGGRDAVQHIQRIRREMLTTWQRTNFRDEPYADAPSFELHTDTRDYGLNAWRNVRKFGFAANAQQIVDVVVDTVAIRQINGAWTGLNIAYVDERRELFAIAPERIVLLMRDAADLRSGRDTLIDGVPTARVLASIDGFAMTLFVRRGDGLPAFSRFRAGQPNDFGLLPWGVMEVETWYSRWGRLPNGVSLPTQLDQRRVGRPYKRMSVYAFAFDTVTSPETFAISDSLRNVYFQIARHSMADVSFDSVRTVDANFTIFGAFGAPVGAVKVGGQWVLVEAGQGEVSATRALEWLRANEAGTPVGAAVLTALAATNGGATALARARVPAYAAPGSEPFLRRIVGNTGVAGVGPTTVTRARWLKVGTDSLWLEPVDLPDAPRTMLVYSPTLKWAYTANASAPLQQQYLLRVLHNHGWAVEKIGHSRAIMVPAPAPR